MEEYEETDIKRKKLRDIEGRRDTVILSYVVVVVLHDVTHNAPPT